MAKFKPAPRLPARPRRSPLQTALLVICIVTAIVSTLVVGYLIVRGPNKAPDEGIEATAPNTRYLGVDQASQIGRTSGLNVQFTDKKDPTRLAGMLTSRTVQPLREQNYAVEDPKIWRFRDDGRSELITAPTGRLVMPDGKNPQAGTLSGGVVYRLFPAMPDGRRADPDKDKPELLATATAVSFNLSTGEAHAPADVTVKTDDAEFAGRDVRVVWDEVEGELKFAEVRSGGTLTHLAKATEPGATGDFEPYVDEEEVESPRSADPARPVTPGVPASGGPTGEAPGVQPGVQPGTGPSEPERTKRRWTRYQLTFLDSVVATHGEKRLEADKLEAWVSLRDGKLPPNAFGDVQRAAATPSGRMEPLQGRTGLAGLRLGDWVLVSAMASQPEQAAPAATGPEEPPAGEPGEEAGVRASLEESARTEPVTLTWTGRMLIEPQTTRPAEMRNNAVAMRFTSERSGLVKFTDAQSTATAHAATIEYQATRRVLTLRSPGANAVRLEMPGSGRLECSLLEMWLATGVGRVPGPGRVSMAAEENANALAAQDVQWMEQADFQFRVKDGMMTGLLEWASFSGNARVQASEALVRGDVLSAWFTEDPNKAEESKLERVEVTGNMRAEDGERGRVAGDKATIEFDTTRDQVVPAHIALSGNVSARRNDVSLSASSVNLDLDEDEAGELTVQGATASGGVEFLSRGDNLAITCDRMIASPEMEVLDVAGPRAVVTRGGAEIWGPAIRFDGRNGTAEVFGAGGFTLRDLEAPSDVPALAEVTWSRQMFFDDTNGRIEALGDAEAINRPEDLTTDVMTGDRIYAEITPRSERAGQGLSGLDGKGQNRDVLRVEVVGRSAFDPKGAPAIVQTMRERLGGADEAREIERLLRLEGPEIIADNVAQRLDVNDPGRLVVADLRPAQEDPAAVPERGLMPAADGDPRGSALFQWKGSMSADRRTNILRMNGGVEMRHLRSDTGVTTYLRCDGLAASAEPRSAGEEADMRSTALRLKDVLAMGNVYLASGAQELSAGEARYDAVSGTAEAVAAKDATVTFFDAARASPINAQRIWWDLIGGRVEVREPGPLVVPGGLR